MISARRRRRSMMKAFIGLAGMFVMAMLLCDSALAQAVYPSKGQSPQQQQQDTQACQGWAMQQSGANPGAPPPPSGPTGQGARGAARGAAVGAVAGGIGGDAGKGAAAGAAAGAMIGGMQRRQDRRAAQSAQANTSAAFNSALAACMEGRGYTVR
jgi:outer membrane protein with glycine zipper